MEPFVKKSIFLSITLFILIAGASAAQSGENGMGGYVIADPPGYGGGDRIPVFLVMSDQPAADASVQTMKALAQSQQQMTMSALAQVDPVAAETARSHWIVNAIHVEAYPADLDSLAALPGVDHIEHDYTVTVTDPVIQTMDEVSADSIHYSVDQGGVVWSADFIDAPAVWETGNLGAGVNISIVDTGIDGSHQAFGDRIVAWADFVNGANETAYDDNGHGTHCAGTAAGGVVETTYGDDTIDVILGIAPEANLMGAKVLSAGGSGKTSDVMDGVEWSVENGADIISMSLGSFLGPWDSFTDKKESFTINNDSSTSVTIEVASSYDTVYEPQFIVGAVNADPSLIYEIEHGENLTFTLTDAQGNTATGGEIDWLGFDTSSGYYYFKAPYADNAGAAWSGWWTATLTNTGNEPVYIQSIKIAACYQSDGQDVESRFMNNVMNLGTTVVVSAGNDGEFGHGTIGVPGVAEDIITVGATDYMMDYWAPFSSIGPVNADEPYHKPDVVAPGVGIISSYMDGGYAILDGTSMSTPAVAGTAALMLSGNNGLDPADIKDSLMSSSVHISENGEILDTMQKNSIYGAGRVDAYEAVNVTGGLGDTPIGDGILYELFGGIVSEEYSVYGDDLPVTAVTWNVTGGVPMAGEDVLFSVRNYYSPYEYENKTVATDASGNARTTLDISDYSDNTQMTLSITWGDHVIEESFYKAATPTPTPTPVGDFIYKSQDYWALTNDTVQIKYPLLSPDGSPYTGDVLLELRDYSSNVIYNETITPVAGVVATDIDLSTIYSGYDYSNYYIYLDDEGAGSLQISPGVDDEWYNVLLSPGTAICSPGSSIDISAILVSEHSGMSGIMKTGSTTATATVVTFGETDINSLTANTQNALLGGELKTFDELNSEIQGMDVSVTSETFQITNGIGLYTLDMPEDGYLALVYVTTPYSMEGYNEASVTVYGEMTPWIRHSATDGTFRNPVTNFTVIFQTSSEWRATWDQQTYSVVPEDEASLGFTVYTYTLDEVTDQFIGAPAAYETVYLYTMDDALTATTDADGRCGFTVTPGDVGDTGYEYLAVTGGLDVNRLIYYGADPLRPALGTRIAADLITLEPVAPASHGYLIPKQATRSIGVVADNASRTITLTSVGPNDESIHEKGMFTFDQSGPYYYSNGTLDAATVEFDRTISKTVEIPDSGTYDAAFRILNPVDSTLQYRGATFVDTDYNLTYDVMDDLLEGTSVPVTFTLTDQNDDPVSGAKVLFKMGAADGWMIFAGEYQIYQNEINPREENIWPYLGEYPDPYSRIYTGYTDASGQVELTFTTPTAAEQAYRLEMGSTSEVYYDVFCVHNDRFVAIDGGWYVPVAGELPDFVPSVDAPHVVKINHNDTVKVDGLGVSVSNVGTADFIYSGTDGVVVAESGGYSENVSFNYDILKGTTEEVLYVNIEQSAQDYGINPETTSLPQDTVVKVTVNPDKGIEELRYDNNVYSHTLRITAPDLVAEVIAPSTTTAVGGVTPIGVKVTNGGQVPSVATTMAYEISGSPIETGISVIALNPGESAIVWRNKTLVAGEYTVAAEVNPGHATDYETSYTNNRAEKDITSFEQVETTIVLPPNKVIVKDTSFELPIVVKNVEELAAYQMTFAYNASVIEVTDVIPGEISLTGENFFDGYVKFNGAQTSSESGNVTIATLAIDVVGESGDETPFTLSEALMWDINEFALPLAVTDGSGYVLLYGDANDDGVVSQLDTLKVLKWVVGIDSGKPISGTTQMLQTDVTKNSHVDVGDAMFIAQFNVGLRDNYFNIP